MLFPILAALVAITLFYGERSSVPQKFEQDLPQLLVPQSTGKERQIVSMTNDASMYTERTRRSVIMAVHSCNASNSKKIRESNKTAGFTNGVVEAYMLTSICNIAQVVPCVTQIYDGGGPTSNFVTVFDGLDPLSDVMGTLYSSLPILDGRYPDTNLC
jgi:hypothetical protein